MENWKTLSRRTILDHSKFLVVEEHVVELPDGQTIPDWPWLILPDFVNVVAVTAEGMFLCFRQTKYAVEGTSLAVLGGYLEPSEDPLEAAKRELREETGYTAEEWVSLGQYPVDGNRGAGTAYPFLARGAYPVADPIEDDLEEQELILLTQDEVEKAVADGAFKLLAWTATLAMALLRLKDEADE